MTIQDSGQKGQRSVIHSVVSYMDTGPMTTYLNLVGEFEERTRKFINWRSLRFDLVHVSHRELRDDGMRLMITVYPSTDLLMYVRRFFAGKFEPFFQQRTEQHHGHGKAESKTG